MVFPHCINDELYMLHGKNISIYIELWIVFLADLLFNPEQSIKFHSTLECVYKETSLRVLELLKGKFRLMEHLHALRNYLLLGQGDFIRHLLELLAWVFILNIHICCDCFLQSSFTC